MKNMEILQRMLFLVSLMLLEMMVLNITTFILFLIVYFYYFPYLLIVIAETSAEFLLGKRFIRTVVDLTFEKISDPEFCQKTSYLLYLTSESLTFILQIYEFFSDIRRFELITALLLEYSSDEKICYSTLAIFSKLLIQEWDKVGIGKMVEDSLKAALGSGILYIIQGLVDRSKDDSLVSLCGVIFQILYHRSKI